MRAAEKLKSYSTVDAGILAALFVLVVGRLPITDPTVLHGVLGPASFPPWTHALILAQDPFRYIYARAALLIIALVLLFRRRDFSRLNIDAPFPYLFIWAAFAFSLGNPGPLGWAAAIMAVFLPLLLRLDGQHIGRIQPSTLRVLFGIAVAFCICLIGVRRILDPGMIRSAIHWMLIDFPPNAVVEEVVFRGLLWMSLRSRGWSDGPVVGFQATLFWLAHMQYLFTDPVGFWVIVPVLSLVLGIITWRTRSLTASTIAHLCMNAGWSLILYATM